MRINGQVQPLDGYRQYGAGKESSSVKNDVSGSANRAGNNAYDASGLLLSVKTRAQNSGLSDISRRMQESISRMQSAEVALQKADATLSSMRELAVNSADIATTNADRIVLDYDFTQFKFELSKIGTLSFSGIDRSKPDVSAFVNAQANAGVGNAVQVSVNAIGSDAIGNIRSVDSANSAISAIGDAMDEIASARSRLGETRVKLTSEIQGSGGPGIKQLHSVSRIGDASAAVNMAERVQSDMMKTPAHSILAIANALPQAVLQLLV